MGAADSLHLQLSGDSPRERALQILDLGGLLHIKAHIFKHAGAHTMLDGLDDLYCKLSRSAVRNTRAMVWEPLVVAVSRGGGRARALWSKRMNLHAVDSEAVVNPAWLSPQAYIDFQNRSFGGQWDRTAYDWYLTRPFDGRAPDLLVLAQEDRILSGLGMAYRQIQIGDGRPSMSPCCSLPRRCPRSVDAAITRAYCSGPASSPPARLRRAAGVRDARQQQRPRLAAVRIAGNSQLLPGC